MKNLYFYLCSEEPFPTPSSCPLLLLESPDSVLKTFTFSKLPLRFSNFIWPAESHLPPLDLISGTHSGGFPPLFTAVEWLLLVCDPARSSAGSRWAESCWGSLQFGKMRWIWKGVSVNLGQRIQPHKTRGWREQLSGFSPSCRWCLAAVCRGVLCHGDSHSHLQVMLCLWIVFRRLSTELCALGSCVYIGTAAKITLFIYPYIYINTYCS